MKGLKQILGNEWHVTQAGGLTGDAYLAENKNKKLFLKRHSSPFLAVLSAEGLVPKLIWTRRLDNGDVITAQEWVEGRKLEPYEMQDKRIAHMLHQFHHSAELLHMLKRLGKEPATADGRFEAIKKQLYKSDLVTAYQDIRLSLKYMKDLLPIARSQEYVVCHCDLNHNNFIETKSKKLYLIDWDNTMIADPIIDFGILLKSYIPEEHWGKWLQNYGLNKDDILIKRMHWYLLLDTLQYINWHNERSELGKVSERLNDLQNFNDFFNR